MYGGTAFFKFCLYHTETNEEYFELNHQATTLSQDTITLAWRVSINETCIYNKTIAESRQLIPAAPLFQCGSIIMQNETTDDNITLPRYPMSHEQILFVLKPQLYDRECTTDRVRDLYLDFSSK